MKKLALFATLLLVISNCFAQQDTAKLKRHTVYVEIGGVTMFGASFNYEYTVLHKGILRINTGIGIASTGVFFAEIPSHGVAALPSVKTLIGKGCHFAEVGWSQLVPNQLAFYTIQGFNLGYRYESKNGHFISKVVFNLGATEDLYHPWIGISLGTKF
ncbi:MAG: hypothetical protein JKY53_09565 [Flavobacteriales bacterium]|nr:hypothetical protein [Flavobacteriales bacterium]